MNRLVRTNSENRDFHHLVVLLDIDLRHRNGNENSFFAQFNKIDYIRHVVLAYDDDKVIGCGAIKLYSSDTMEVRRMFVMHEYRGRGIAGKILRELETWCRELNIRRCILETGRKQQGALRLYDKCGYQVIQNYGQYRDMESSVCFEKYLEPLTEEISK